jgi:hypothetical protein
MNLGVIAMPNRVFKLPRVCIWITQLVARGLTQKYDIVQIESFSLLQGLALFFLMRPISRKSVIVFHDKYFERDPRDSTVGKVQLVLQRILLTVFDASITPGSSVRKWFEKLHGVLANKIAVMPNGAPNFTIREDIDSLKLRRKYGLDSGAFVALFFGAMTFKPNYDAAMYLYRLSNSISYGFKTKTGTKLIFIVAGIGSDALPRTQNYVPLGFVSRLDELLSLPDAIVFPHLPSYSGPHVKTIYAFLSKKPVVASEDAVKDMPLVARGKHFLPFNVDVPDTLLESLTELHRDKKSGTQIALNAHLYSKEFSWRNISCMHLKLYERLLS